MMTKIEALTKMEEKGAYDALELRNEAATLTETEIIDLKYYTAEYTAS